MSAVLTPTGGVKRRLPAFRSRAARAATSPADAADYGDIIYRHENILVNPEGTWAYFVLAGVPIANRSLAAIDSIIKAGRHRFAANTGSTIRSWGVPSEFPADAFEERMVESFPRAVTEPAAPGARTFRDQLDAKTGFIRALRTRKLVTVIAVRLTKARVPREHLPRVIGNDACPPPLSRIEEYRREYRRIRGNVARSGWQGRAVTTAGMDWVLRATRAPGLSSPPAQLDRWDAYDDDESGFNDPIRATGDKFGLHTTIRGVRRGVSETSFATVLRLSSAPDERDTQDHEPWLAWVDSLGPQESDPDSWWRVQWAFTVDVVPGSSVMAAARNQARLARAVANYYSEHDSDDRSPARVEERAEEIFDETSDQRRPETSSRGRGQVFLIVSASSLDVLQDAVQDVEDAASSEQDFVVSRDYGQWADYRRTIVGNVWDMSGHIVQKDMTWWASAIPNGSTAAGDPSGFPLGNIAGSNNTLLFNALAGPSNGRAGVGVLDASQGAGKTTTAVAIVDDLCAGGVPGMAFSPDAMIGQILNARQYANGRGRMIDLTQITVPGIAMPSMMVPPPLRQPGMSDDDYEAQVSNTDAHRMRYERDVLRSVLPMDLQRGDIGAALAIEEAVAASGGEYGVSPWQHVARLESSSSETARRVGAALRMRAAQPTGRLVFPDARVGEDEAARRIRGVLESDALFTVVTVSGLQLPQTANREDWSEEHYDSVPVLMSGLRFSALSLLSNRDPGWYIGDEVDIAVGGVGAFSTFVRQLIYDIRRYDKFAALLVKSMSTLSALDEDVTSLLGWSALGRMGVDGARSGLRLLGDVDPSIADEVPDLEDGEWLWRGWDNEVRRVQIDQSWWPEDTVRWTNTKPADRPNRLATPLTDW